jgi:hypothetical protein
MEALRLILVIAILAVGAALVAAFLSPFITLLYLIFTV